MTALLVLLYFVAIMATLLLLAEWLDRRLDNRFPSYARGWARVFGEPVDPPVHVQVVSTSPRPCPACGARGWHHQGCSVLDRLDAGEVRP